MRDERLLWIVAILVVTGGAVALWYFRAQPEPAPSRPALGPTPVEEPAEEAPGRPLHPLPEDGDDGEPVRDLRPLPALDESDEYFRLELEDLFGAGIGDALVASGLIERVVATVDNLPRERVAERIRPLASLEEPFAVAEGADGESLTLDERTHRRYDALIERFMNADLDAAVELYRRYYPLFQKAYVVQGYPEGYFNDRLVEVIDHLLATPEVEPPIPLERPHVLYEFANPELENLSGGQKLMLRLGPDNAARVKQRLRALRARIVES